MVPAQAHRAGFLAADTASVLVFYPFGALICRAVRLVRGGPTDLPMAGGLTAYVIEAEHRDFALPKPQRETDIIICQFRAADAESLIEIDQ